MSHSSLRRYASVNGSVEGRGGSSGRYSGGGRTASPPANTTSDEYYDRSRATDGDPDYGF